MWKAKRHGIILFVIILALYLVIGGSASAATIYVDDNDKSADYETIQTALNAAVDGDTIIVKPGTYPDELIQVNTSVTIKGASGYPSVGGFDIYRQSRIEGLTITKGVGFDQGGIECTIRNNRFEGCGVSIGNSYLYGNQTIMNNLFTGSKFGVSTYDSWNNKITGNTFQKCDAGIKFTWGGGGHVVTGNTFKNCGIGIHIIDEQATIYNNYFSNNINLQVDELHDRNGPQLNTKKTTGENIIDGPYIAGNYWATPAGDGFSQTHLDTNGDGIAEKTYQIAEGVIDYLPLVTPRTESEPVLPVANFKANTVSGNAPLSVLFTDLSQNATSRSWNFGDGATSTDKNPTHSYSLAGNYTVNLTVSNLKDTDSKTAIITVLEKEEEEKEENENVNENNNLPVVDFSTNVISGSAPLSVLFTDLSQNATSRSWDVNNDGIEDSKEASFVYVYTATGTYTVKLTVSNENGTSPKTTLITVENESIDGSSHSNGGSSHSNGGSSSGGGGSPEPARNVETKELSQVFITNGKAVKFDFTKDATCVVYVSFDAKKTVGKTTTIVEELKNKSSLVSELPEGKVYKSFNVWVGNSGFATSKNIENPVVCFKVEKSWLQDKKIDKDSIILNRYSEEKWEQLPVNLLEEDDKFLYFTAETPAFSSFVITGKAKSLSEEDSTETEPEKETRAAEEEMKSIEEEVEPNSGQEEDTKAPGFEIGYGIICMSAIFLHKRKQKN
ncbi:hypothetical protein EO98_12500 [Methanosarcina sp. 2.H.T.1A.6]|uniref:PGF-pre-PGF domain-containing protein n=1 Tax=unclassified Methanosarcina TaxID=2644672 RepID=UPI000621C451|nr:MULTISPECIES: PGF-pre-PGF domain-containing protein [unclassified Methanosarcina]KKG16194.1 hypothetical protein EO94_08930 [Methanosarcina sp. 2.H.T.1A.3]KKG23086.1 hypothetical protein EO98_12500 [Methanosarcina sp. 2.H.T.1A.6]KKG26309.1 hypothetical protein EO96_04985 [Methanosarcina sp. 2.H.T.1A.8]KKG26828.1 hypothetical protein EO97_19375 [Methanosarcina sp. 2.H.T.1A.15]